MPAKKETVVKKVASTVAKTVKKAVTAKPAAPARKAAKKAAVPTVTPEERQKRIELAAYFKAEKNGFQGDPQQYWLEAMKEVDEEIAAGK